MKVPVLPPRIPIYIYFNNGYGRDTYISYYNGILEIINTVVHIKKIHIIYKFIEIIQTYSKEDQ